MNRIDLQSYAREHYDLVLVMAIAQDRKNNFTWTKPRPIYQSVLVFIRRNHCTESTQSTRKCVSHLFLVLEKRLLGLQAFGLLVPCVRYFQINECDRVKVRGILVL